MTRTRGIVVAVVAGVLLVVFAWPALRFARDVVRLGGCC